LKRVTENDSFVIPFVDTCFYNLCVFVFHRHCCCSSGSRARSCGSWLGSKVELRKDDSYYLNLNK
jgi:hypothetical protein